MNFLVVSRLSIPDKDRTLPAWEHLRSLGHTVTVEHPGQVPAVNRPDAIISMGISIMDETFLAMERFPRVPAFMYNWDCYEWVWEPGQEGKKQAFHAIRNQGQQREHDYVKYGKLLRHAAEVWVPSRCTGERTEQWWGLKNWAVIKSACPWWDPTPPVKVRDGGHALCCLREIPDRHWGLFERACSEAGIPYVMTKHEQSRADYERAVAECRFIVAPLHELSTGGLSLLEAYRLGKPVLVSNSKWNAAGEYFGDRAKYFMDGDFDNLKHMLRWMMATYAFMLTPRVAPDHKEWIEDNFNDRRMVEDILARVRHVTGETA